MFERYTEKARRVIFYARYEASQYGSAYIETEHFLLGLLREDPNLADLLPNQKPVAEIRREIEKHIEPRERISTSVEVPLSADCKRALYAAAEEANRLGSHHVGTDHLLLGLLRIKDGVPAHILHVNQVQLAELRGKLRSYPLKRNVAQSSVVASTTLIFMQAMENFLAALRNGNLKELEDSFGPDSCFVDACGKLWKGQKEIVANFELLLAPFAKRGAKPASETHTSSNETLWAASLIWEDVHLPGFSPLDLFRMSIVFGMDEGISFVYLMQITPIGREASGKTAAP